MQTIGGGVGQCANGLTTHMTDNELEISRLKLKRRYPLGEIRICNLRTLQGNYRWRHSTNRTVSLESTHILLLHEFERVALKRVALQKLNSSDLGFTARIPKGNEGRR